MAFLRRCKTNNSTVWRIYYRIGEKQKTKTIGKVDKKTAEKCFQEFCNIQAKRDFSITETKRIDIRSFFKLYLELTKSEKAPSTVEREVFVINHFLKFIGDVFLNQICYIDVVDYRQNRLNHVSDTTVNIEIRHLKAIFNTAKRLGYLTDNPFIKVKPLKIAETGFPKFFEVEDIGIIRKAFKDDEFEHLIEFYILTGSRLQEPLSLTWDDVDFRRERIIIKGENTKAKRNRIIDFKDDDKLKKLLGNIPKRSDNRLFGLPNVEKQWSRFWVGEKIRKIFGELGYPWASCKTFRHSFISHLVMSGVPLITVQELVGHANFSTTLKYSHLAQAHKGAMIKKRPY